MDALLFLYGDEAPQTKEQQEIVALRAELAQVRQERDAFARQYDRVRNDPDYQQCCELRRVAEQQLATARQAVWGEAAKVVCPRCAQGYPLQKNGGWHNDMNGRDTLVNALCRGAECRAKAKEAQP